MKHLEKVKLSDAQQVQLTQVTAETTELQGASDRINAGACTSSFLMFEMLLKWQDFTIYYVSYAQVPLEQSLHTSQLCYHLTAT